ncbi:MAG: AAA family ATPase [Myxococcales bacterium]|nr:AAA family ATPase [Myxococcales bacterium]
MTNKLDVYCSLQQPRLFGRSFLYHGTLDLKAIDVPSIDTDARLQLIKNITPTTNSFITPAIILVGKERSGKTHLLGWLSQQFSEKSIPVKYVQGLENIPKPLTRSVHLIDSIGMLSTDEERFLSIFSQQNELLEQSHNYLTIFSVTRQFFDRIQRYPEYPSIAKRAPIIKLKPEITAHHFCLLIAQRLKFLWRTAELQTDQATSVDPLKLTWPVTEQNREKWAEAVNPFSINQIELAEKLSLKQALRALDKARRQAQIEQLPVQPKVLMKPAPQKEAPLMPEAPPAFDITQLLPLTRITLENFRGARSVEVDLHPRITVFFAENAGGKTTILEAAVQLLLPLLKGLRNSTKIQDLRPVKEDFGPAEADIHRPAVEHTARIKGKGTPSAYTRVAMNTKKMRWDLTRPLIIGDEKSIPESWGLDGLDKIFYAVRSDLPKLPISSDELEQSSNKTFDLPLFLYFGAKRSQPELPERDRKSKAKTKNSRFDAYENALSTTNFLRIFEWFARREKEERLAQESKGSSYRLPALEWVRKALSEAIPTCQNPRMNEDSLHMLVDFTPKEGHIETLDLDELSHGYRTHFCMVFDIACRMVQLNPSDDLTNKHRGTNTRAVVLIDEIDLHLHPVWQESVTVRLLDAFPNAQFLVTTHSVQVIGTLHKSCIRKLLWKDGEINIANVDFAEGASGDRIRIELMGGRERVPSQETDGKITKGITDLLKKYADLIQQGIGRSSEAKKIRVILEEELTPNDPRLVRAEFEIKRLERVAELKKRKPR